MNLKNSRVLVITLPLNLIGGVQSKARYLATHLSRNGYEVAIASYASRSNFKDINVSWLRSVFGAEGRVEVDSYSNQIKTFFIGCRFPGAEFTYTENSSAWRRVLNDYDRIIAVGGTPLIAHPAAVLNKRFVLWCADDLLGDRNARMKAMSVPRRFADLACVLPRLKQQQSLVLRSGMPIRGISEYSVKQLRSHLIEGSGNIDHLPIPIASDFFRPCPELRQKGVMGFSGRISDPRKNARLLFESFRELRRRKVVQELRIAGPVDEAAIHLAETMGISSAVNFLGNLSREQLCDMYQSLEVFAITSFREGLGISGLEAMACGVPVVSTQCGGTEDFVRQGVTGYISGFSSSQFADSVCKLLGDHDDYNRISAECRLMVKKDFSESTFSLALDEAWQSAWGESYLSRG